MNCKKPYARGLLAFGCGQCLPCRINRSRLWTHRLMLESLKHGDSSFVTLTYREEDLPPGGTLVPKDAQDWLKRLRAAISPARVRFFLVGEYGDRTERPHYHAALFGVPGCLHRYPDAYLRSKCKCEACVLIRSTWSKGNTDAAFLSKDSAGYLAGYVTKKMTHPESKCTPACVHPRLKGRHPEFARMSLKPGIGAPAVPELADLVTSDPGVSAVELLQDVPFVLKHGGKPMPLGKYLRRKLRDYVVPDKAAQTEVKEKALLAQQMQVLELLEGYSSATENVGRDKWEVFREKRKQKIVNKESKFKVFSAKKGRI